MALRFVTTDAKVRWDKVALDLVVGNLLGSGVVSSYSGKAKVVAVNNGGEAQVVETVDPDQSAEDRMALIETDYELLSTHAWCEKYNVPITFAEA